MSNIGLSVSNYCSLSLPESTLDLHIDIDEMPFSASWDLPLSFMQLTLGKRHSVSCFVDYLSI